jgi:ABC-2 type transport system permease protein
MIDPTWARRGGARHLWAGYRHMLRYEVISTRTFLMFALVVQTVMGAGMGVMYGFYLGDLPSQAVTFLVAGVPALALFPLGFVLVPGNIANLRVSDTYDYLWSLPVPRVASAAATFTTYTAVALPGTVLALVISTLVYDVELRPNWGIVPAVLLSAAMATSVGYAVGHGMKDARMVNLVTNFLVFLILMFSPIVVPIDLFPGWFAAVHRVLPFWHVANLVRAGLTEGFVADVGASYVAVMAWTAGSMLVAARVIARRR